jgi:hypothetical protein
VTIRLDDRVIGEIATRGRWQRHDFQVGPPQKEWLLLTIEVEPTFRPFSDVRKYPELGPSTDIRHLGAAIRWIHWQEEEHEVQPEAPTSEPVTTEDDASR